MHKIDMEKCLLSIVWSVNGIYSLLDVPKGTVYNTVFYIDAIMPILIENARSRTRMKMLNAWLTHMDSAHLDNSRRAQRGIKASRAEHLPHRAYSSDLAPSDFFLFGYIKGKLSDHNCESREALWSAITEIFPGVDQKCCSPSSNARETV
jgi:hypothetical protein